jgi:ATP-dependent RNA helicase HelY
VIEAHTFTLDRFQLEAIAELDRGHSVLVAAPTGSGKTVVAEAAIDLALAAGGKAFYTTPIKALSNQKFADLSERLGPARVGLLTGDNAVRADAPVVVMTTEVLRNMIYAESPALDRLHVVVLDEVHYLQDAYRGSVWEEVIIGLPANVRLVALSATISNAPELGEWIGAVRGPTGTVVETERPIELQPLYLVGDRNSDDDHLVPILVDGRPNPEGHRFTEDPRLARRRPGGRFRRRFVAPRRVETVERLADDELLPAIYFIFSRAACDDAVRACRDAGLRLTTPAERREIRALVEERLVGLTDDDLDALDFDLWLVSLEMGVAAHHAGMIPAFKEAVEAAFTRGLVKVVFATETLALGINMPARSVVIEKLSKYNGETHEFLTPGEFTQLTGRAGRRGIDEVGYAIVAWSPFVTFDQVAALVASRSFPLASSFRPTYNMVANLIQRYERDEAYEVIGQSFAQFQADRAMVGLQRRLHDDRRRLASLDEAIACDRGDATEYAALAERATRAARRAGGGSAAVMRAAAMLRPGDLVEVPASHGGGRGDSAIVISVAHRGRGAIRIRLVDAHGDVVVLDAADLAAPIHPIANVDLPVPFAPEDPAFLDACAALVAVHPVGRRAVRQPQRPADADPHAELAAHPVHGCPDREAHLTAVHERARVEKEAAQLASAVRRREGSLARRLDAVVDLLDELGFVDGWALTAAGERLARVFHECDLVIATALDAGVFDGLEPPELAAVVSTVTYEERRSDAPPSAPVPHQVATRRIEQLRRIARDVQRSERDRGLPRTRLPDSGFAAAARSWAMGRELAAVLADDLSAGDFVRNVKVLVDLLDQLAEAAAAPDTRLAARRAAQALTRGVVAAADPRST